ncbi:MAG: hypothetical protein VXY93_15805, partial [Pseudomonadota bacterium]|nr:hypothetical protein [Pseudomonadota bacterium]
IIKMLGRHNPNKKNARPGGQAHGSNILRGYASPAWLVRHNLGLDGLGLVIKDIDARIGIFFIDEGFLEIAKYLAGTHLK